MRARFAILFFSFFMLAQPAFAQFYGFFPSSKASRNDKPAKLAVVGAYMYSANEFSSFTSSSEFDGSGSGYALGGEINTQPGFWNGQWILGIYYSAQSLQITQDAGTEILKFQSIQAPIAWGFTFASRFYIGLGLMLKMGIGNIERKSASADSSVSYDEYGLNALYPQSLVIARLYFKLNKQRQFFADFKYASGLSNRAIGSDDSWKEQDALLGIGITF